MSLLEYGNSTVTSSTTIYGNISSLSESLGAQVSMMVETEFPGLDDGLYGGNGFAFANGTDGAFPGGVTTFPYPYPTPYVVVAGISVFTNLPSAGCPLNQPQYISSLLDTVIGPQAIISGVGVFTIDLGSTMYSPLTIAAAFDFFGQFDLDPVSFSRFLASNTSLLSYIPYLTSCSYLTFGVGPPMLQLPATALTASVTTTVKESAPYPTDSPAPGSVPRPSVPLQTMTPTEGNNQGSPDPSSPNQISPTSNPPNQDSPNQGYSVQVQGAPNRGSSNPKQGSPNQGTPSHDSSNQESSNKDSSNDSPNLDSNHNPSPSQYSPSQGAGSQNSNDQGSGPGKSVSGSGYQRIVSFGGALYTADASSRFIIAGQTVSPAGPAITISGTPISIALSATAAIIGTKTIPIADSPALDTPSIAPVLTFAGSTYKAGTSSAFVIEGQTLTPGASIEVQGTQIFYPSDGSEIVVGTSTQPLSLATITSPVLAPVLTFDGSAFTAGSSSQFIIDGQTLVPGTVVTVLGTPISYAAAGSAVIIGSSTESFSYARITPTAALFTFDGSTYTADASSDFLVDGQTLVPDGIITVSGTPISYAAAGSAVVIGTSTESLLFAKITPVTATIVFDGSTYTADESSDFLINGQTLAPGDIVTVSGTPISYASDGTDVVVGTSTEAVGIGGLIMSGFGAGGGGPASTGALTFSGGAVGERYWSGVLLGAAVTLSFYSALL